jgi:hypothetical protein
MNGTKGKIKKAGIYLLMILIVNAGYLFSKKIRPDDEKYLGMFEINQSAHFFVTMDAWGYIAASMDPQKLLTDHEVRQSRPLYIVQNSILGEILLFVTIPFHNYMQHNDFFNRLGQRVVDINEVVIIKLGDRVKILPNVIPPKYNQFDLAVKISIFYFAYVLSNLLILLLSLLFFESIWKKISDASVDSGIFYISLFFLLSNFLIKTFFWTAHQQMCPFLSPIFCVWLCLSVADGTIRGTKRLLAYSFLGGLLMLYYGNFILIFPSIILPYLWINRKELFTVRVALFFISSAVLFAIPMLSWMLILKSIGVTYYNHETAAFNELVWIFDLRHLTVINIIKTVLSNFIWYFFTLKVLLSIICWLIIVSILFGRPISNVWKKKNFVWVSVVIFVFLVFFYSLGLYVDRLTYNVSVALFCLTPFFVQKMNITKGRTAFVAFLSLLWYVAVIISYKNYN